MAGKGDRNRTSNFKQAEINYKQAFNKKCKTCDLIANNAIEAEIECLNCLERTKNEKELEKYIKREEREFYSNID